MSRLFSLMRWPLVAKKVSSWRLKEWFNSIIGKNERRERSRKYVYECGISNTNYSKILFLLLRPFLFTFHDKFPKVPQAIRFRSSLASVSLHPNTVRWFRKQVNAGVETRVTESLLHSSETRFLLSARSPPLPLRPEQIRFSLQQVTQHAGVIRRR